MRGDGETTYLAADVAYHLDKAARGHDRLIDVLGADHHGYIARLRAVLAAGGHDPDMLEVVLVQLVSLLERGEAKRMSKRAGTVVTLADLLDDIGVDAARFFLVQRSHETPLDLDLDLAREQSQENPVYYVQYAHARVCSILRPGRRARGPRPRRRRPPAELDPAERALVLRLADWPSAVAEAEERRAPHRVVAYLDRAGPRLPRLLPPLPRGGGGARGRGLPPGRLPRDRRDRPARPRPARRGGARADVAAAACPWYRCAASVADVAQLVERRLPKPKVAGSRPVVRFVASAPRRLVSVQATVGHRPSSIPRLAHGTHGSDPTTCAPRRFPVSAG